MVLPHRPRSPSTATADRNAALQGGIAVELRRQRPERSARKLRLADARQKRRFIETASHNRKSSDSDRRSHTVRKWHARYVEEGLPGLSSEPRPGRPENDWMRNSSCARSSHDQQSYLGYALEERIHLNTIAPTSRCCRCRARAASPSEPTCKARR